MQIEPIKPELKPPGSKRLKLEYEKPLSNVDLNFNLRRYIKGECIVFNNWRAMHGRKYAGQGRIIVGGTVAMESFKSKMRLVGRCRLTGPYQTQVDTAWN